MQVAIIGLPLSGKSTIFDLISVTSSGKIVHAGENPTSLLPRKATVHIPDPRLSYLHEKHPEKSMVMASLEILDFPPLQLGQKDARYAELIALISKCDALVIVVRAFENDSCPHPLGSISPQRDIRELTAEMDIRDLEILEKRLQKLSHSIRKSSTGRARDEEEIALLRKLAPLLEEGRSFEEITLSPDEMKSIRGFQFFRLKPRHFILNIGEEMLAQEEMFEGLENIRYGFTRISAKIELEVASLDPDERESFASEYGLVPDTVQRMMKHWLDSFGMISFYSIGKDEVRAWLVPKDSTAIVAAGKIHSDIAKGFISAEVVGFDDFKACNGSMKEVKSRGRMRLEGRDYQIQDGDIVYFRFNI